MSGQCFIWNSYNFNYFVLTPDNGVTPKPVVLLSTLVSDFLIKSKTCLEENATLVKINESKFSTKRDLNSCNINSLSVH